MWEWCVNPNARQCVDRLKTLLSQHRKLMIVTKIQDVKNKERKFYGKRNVQAWGADVVLEDLCGNFFDLVQHLTH